MRSRTRKTSRTGTAALMPPARAIEVVQILGDHHLPVGAPQPVVDFVLPRLHPMLDDRRDLRTRGAITSV